jgi:hypothetical protein
MANDTLSTPLQSDISWSVQLLPPRDLRTDDELAAATTQMTEVQRIRRGIKKHYKQLRDPINEARAINIAAEKDWLRKVEPVESRLNYLISTYTKVQKQRLEDEAKQILQVVKETGSLKDVTPAPITITPPVEVRPTYSAMINPEDFATLVKAVADGTVPLDALTPDWVWINKQARNMKEAFEKKYAHAGLKLVVKETVVTR